MNIFSNSVPNKFVYFIDRDPSWMTSNIKDKISYCNQHLQGISEKEVKLQIDYIKLQNTLKELSEFISTRGNDYKLHLANAINLSNSNYFMSAKICLRENCIYI